MGFFISSYSFFYGKGGSDYARVSYNITETVKIGTHSPPYTYQTPLKQ